MTRDEFETAWHDWMRGVLLVVSVIVLVVIYLLDLFSQTTFSFIMVGFGLVVMAVLVVGNCICSLLPGWVKMLQLPLLIAAGLFFAAGVSIELIPGPRVAVGEVSTGKNSFGFSFPGRGDLLVRVFAEPGMHASKDDAIIKARLVLKSVDFSRNLPCSFGALQKSGGGNATVKLGKTRSKQFTMDDAPAGDYTLVLESLEPAGAMPLKVEIARPWLSPIVPGAGLAVLGIAALLLGLLSAKRAVFPTLIPGIFVLNAAFWMTRRGLPPAEPVLPLLGYLVISGLAGALVGYAVAWLLHRKLKPVAPSAMPKRAKGEQTSGATGPLK